MVKLKTYHFPSPPVRPHHRLHLRVEEAEGQGDHQTVAGIIPMIIDGDHQGKICNTPIGAH